MIIDLLLTRNPIDSNSSNITSQNGVSITNCASQMVVKKTSISAVKRKRSL